MIVFVRCYPEHQCRFILVRCDQCMITESYMRPGPGKPPVDKTSSYRKRKKATHCLNSSHHINAITNRIHPSIPYRSKSLCAEKIYFFILLPFGSSNNTLETFHTYQYINNGIQQIDGKKE